MPPSSGRWTTWPPAGTGRRRTSSPCACSGQPSPYPTIAFPNRPPLDPGAPRPGRAVAPQSRRPGSGRSCRFLRTLTFTDPPAARPQVAAAHVPHPDAAGDVPGRPVRPHRPRPVCRLPVHGQPVEVAAPQARAAHAEPPRPGGQRVRHVHPPVPQARRGAEARQAGPVARTAVRRPRGRPGRGNGRRVPPARPGAFRRREAAARPLLRRAQRYETNKFQLSADERAEVACRWGHVIERDGYGDRRSNGSRMAG